ncbi:MAG: hypothetical protein J7K26_03280 [Candidatus Aenigmarchaeota archaeon]|nr:hypothetical protein [Candidatus Aenigmarchaeota archaeon]
MKGIELPINLLVIISIAVIVLLGLIAMYTLGIGPFTASVGLESVKNAACAALQRDNCVSPTDEIIVNFDANKDGEVNPGIGADFDPNSNVKTDFVWNAADESATTRATKTNKNDNLAALCKYYYNKESDAACKALCGCPGYY